MVAHSGENRGELNLKEGGLAPIASLARWLAIASGDVRGGTIERLHRAGELGLLESEESEILSGAFSEIHQLVFNEEIRAIRDGQNASTWVDPKSLDSLNRAHLRESFRSISAIQNRLENSWQSRLK